MSRTIIAAVFGFLAVALGAFGAHSLKSIVAPDLLATYQTGVFYHLTHSIVLFLISQSHNKFGSFVFYAFCSGIILFSFSLYLYVITGLHSFVYLTPVGGLTLLVGWLSIIITVVKNNKPHSGSEK